jgi:very-short-patch-repair endonuclease
MPLAERRSILEDSEYIPVRTYAEAEIHGKIAKAFAHTDIRLQYAVGQYRVDLFFPEYSLVVECDEYGHELYDAEQERARHAFITGELGCKWIRYDPFDEDFDVFDLINQIGGTMRSIDRREH